LGIVKYGYELATVRAHSLGFGVLSDIALYCLIIPGIIFVLVGCVVKRFRPSARGNLSLWFFSFEMAQWLSLLMFGVFWLAVGLVLVFLEAAQP
jgi:hypothetical protein